MGITHLLFSLNMSTEIYKFIRNFLPAQFFKPYENYWESVFYDYLIISTIMISGYFISTGILYVYYYLWLNPEDNSTQQMKIQPKLKTYNRQRELIFSEIKWSLVTLVIGAMFFTYVWEEMKHGRHGIYFDINKYGLPWVFATFTLAFVINDTYMYWVHRFFHTKFGYQFHKIHHQYYAPTPFSTMTFHPVEAFTFFFPLLLLLHFPVY